MTRVNPKRQVTIPVQVLAQAALESGDVVWVEVVAPVVVQFVSAQTFLQRLAGAHADVSVP